MQPVFRTSVMLFIFWTVLVAAGLVTRPLLPVDETRYLAVAWEMWRRGDFLVPYLNGEPYSHKPPLLFWGMHLGWAVFGVSDWWPRLVAPLFGLISLFGTWRLAQILWPSLVGVGATAAWLVLGALYWTLFTTMTMFDMLHAASSVFGIIGLVIAARDRAALGFLVLGFSIGVGILGKGPAILVHLLPPALTAPVWAGLLGWDRGWGRWYAGVAAALVMGAAVGLAWAIPAAVAGGEAYADAIFWGQSAGRMVDSFAHGRPFWWFAAILPGMILPWMIWPATWRAIRFGWRDIRVDGGLRLAAIWFGVAFLVFSAISGKQPHYLVPEFPALALVLARLLTDMQDAGATPLWRSIDHWVPAGLVLTLVAVLAVVFHFDLKPSWMTSAGDAELWPLALVIMVVGGYLCRPGVDGPTRVARVAALSVVMVIGGQLTLRPLMEKSHDFKPFAEQLKTFEEQGYSFVTFGKYHGQFHFLGRLTRPFKVVDGPAALERWLARHPKAMIIALHRSELDGPPPAAQTRFRSRHFGAWRADDYPPRRKRLQRSS